MMAAGYQVLGPGIAPMLGRERLLTEVVSRLTKATPDHVQVVGPKLYGKSVFLNGVRRAILTDAGSGYTAATLWDLRHRTPNSDAQFVTDFLAQIRETIISIYPELSAELDPQGYALEDLQTLFDILADDHKRILVVLDGFDHVLRSTGITRNLWDQLRDLGQRSSLRYVTGSRLPLRELCMTDEAQTSDFWTLFNPTPTIVGILSDEDLAAFCLPLEREGISLVNSGRSGISNWTGGIPLLTAALLDRIFESSSSGDVIDHLTVDASAEAMIETSRDLMSALIADCSLEQRTILAELSRGPISSNRISHPILNELRRRGFVRDTGGRVHFASRLIESQVRRDSSEVEDLRRYFGSRDGFVDNAKTVLELRLAQILRCDTELKMAVQRAIRELPDVSGALIHVRRIADRSLELIWSKELTDGRTFPSDWMAYWTSEQAFCPNNGLVPPQRGHQVRCLEVMTGTGRANRVAQYVTKPTAMLVSHVHSVGDFGQHQEGPIELGTAISFCYSAVELCESLTADLSRRSEAS